MTGKKIVFIAPEFFTFHKQIQARLEQLGNEVHFIPDRPSQKAIIKILIRKFRFLLNGYLDRFFASRAAQIPPDIDEVFIIRGEGLTAQALRALRLRFAKARFQLYLWDSVRRSPGAEDLMPLVDRTWTYDLRDHKKYPQLKFTPNFYTLPGMERAPRTAFKWDMAFFGTVHADRLRVISRLSQKLPAKTRFYRFFYFQSPVMYWFRRLFDPAFSHFNKTELSLRPKFGKEWEDIVAQTGAILDVQHPEQGGLTIRTLESLALGYKVVTTDPSIREYEFYDPRQILVIDRQDPEVSANFLDQPNDFAIHPKIKDLELTPWLGKVFDA